MPAKSSKQKATVAYLSLMSPDASVMQGGLMVTDGYGLPVEFRYSEPIQPTKLQQILYGASLHDYLKHEVIVGALLEQAETSFDLLLVEDDSFLALENKKLQVLRVSDTSAPPLAEPGQYQSISGTELLLQTGLHQSPVRVQFNEASEDESQDITTLLSRLIELGQKMDVVEPLQRIQRALEALKEPDAPTALAEAPSSSLSSKLASAGKPGARMRKVKSPVHGTI